MTDLDSARKQQRNLVDDGLVVSRAWSDLDFDQIAELNHRTFAGEIPQHAPQPDGRLHDPRLDASTCFVARRRGRVVGMLTLSTQRPFSIDHKVKDLDALLPRHLVSIGGLCEVRLLAIDPSERGGRAFGALMRAALQYARERELNCAVISATTRQLRLYRRFGFLEFGPLLGTKAAQYQGMALDWTRLGASARQLAAAKPGQRAFVWNATKPRINLLPGPVEIHSEVNLALAEPSLSHRGERFKTLFASVRARLRELSGANFVQIFQGSGTLANDVVAAQLATLHAPGLIVDSGEFGHRLLGHARGANLEHETLSSAYAKDLDYQHLEDLLRSKPELRWLWLAHCETSSGVVHRLPRLEALCRRTNVRLALDCISSVGVVPLNLESVFLASATSGKALGSFAGLGIVFHAETPRNGSMPSALNLASYALAGGVAFTISTNQIRALDAALSRFGSTPKAQCSRPEPVGPSVDARFALRQAMATRLRMELNRRGFSMVAQEDVASPAVTTVRLPQHLSSLDVGNALYDRGFRVSYQSSYLVQANEIQLCLMSETPPEEALILPDLLASICADLRNPRGAN